MPRKKKYDGRKNSRKIGYEVERDCRNFWKTEGYLAIMVPNKKRRNNAEFQQWGPFAKWDIIVVKEADVYQCKRQKKYMSKEDKEILKQSFNTFPKTKLSALLCWRENGLKNESL